MDIRYLTTSIAALFEMRQSTDGTLDTMLRRIESELPTPSASRFRTVRRQSRRSKVFKLLIATVQSFRMASALSRALHRTDTVTFVGISLKRVKVPLAENIGPALAQLTRSNVGSLINAPTPGELVIVFDSDPILPELGNAVPEAYVIANPLALILAALPRLITSIPGAWNLLRHLHRAVPSAPTMALLAIAVFWNAVECLFGRGRHLRFITTTSNSVLLEALRIWCLQSPACSECTEIMHGIPVPVMDAYLASLPLHDADNYKIVPQIPLDRWKDPLAKLGRAQAFCNLGVNSMFIQSLPSAQDWTISNLTNVVLTRSSDTASDTRTAVFFGNNHSAVPFFNSSAYRLELRMLEEIRDAVHRRSEQWRIVYLAHPAHGRLEAGNQEEILKYADEISYESHVWFFAADCALGLYSSCLLEVAAFNVPVFSAVQPSDGVFYATMIDSYLEVPAGGSMDELITGLAGFIERIEIDEALLDERVAQRLIKLYPTLD